MSQNNFHYAISLAQMLYDVEGDMDDLEEIGLVAYNFIGNKNTRLYRTTLNVINGVVELPCNCDIIEAVTYCGEDWNYTSNQKDNGDLRSAYIENYIESRKAFSDPFYISGKFVKYKRSGNLLYVDKGLSQVNILYHGVELDEEGLPTINDKEAIAIAEYIAYTYKYKEAIRTNNANVLQIAKDLKQQWLFHCDAARVAEYVSQEEMNKILDVQSSWGRKVFGKSYKPIM